MYLGILWIPMDSHGSLWIPMDSYGFVWIPGSEEICSVSMESCPNHSLARDLRSGISTRARFFWQIFASPMVATVSIRSKTFSSLLFLRFPGSGPASLRGGSGNLPRGGPGNRNDRLEKVLEQVKKPTDLKTFSNAPKPCLHCRFLRFPDSIRDRGDPQIFQDSFLGIHENPSNPFSSTGSTKRDCDPCQIPFWKVFCVADGRDDVESFQNLL